MTPLRLAILALAALAPAVAAADPAPPAPAPPDAPSSYALVVGANRGGDGQAELRFAEADAGRVAAVLAELGGYPADRIRVMAAPTPAALEVELDRLAVALAQDLAAGRQTQLFFYYSGHARASGLSLGHGELALASLRARLDAMPATLTVVVLDACQSGAFARVKGAEPAADFSINSTRRLGQRGVAVMASSSATELSQESDRLGSSYFTHHLLVGLRGAGDASGDGQVTLDEAYRYAYHQTLVATAATRVGAQHASLEVALTGKGEVPLSYPARADAHVELPAGLTGEVLVSRARPRTVVAEVHKAAGGAVRLALPAAAYEVVVRRGERARRCEVTARRGEVVVIDPTGCAEIAVVDETTKGAAPALPRWSFDLAIGLGNHIEDAYDQRLVDFGYYRAFDLVDPRLAVGLLGRLGSHLELGGQLASLDDATYYRDVDTGQLEFSWQTWGVAAVGRVSYPLWGGWLTPYAEANAGLAISRTRLKDAVGAVTKETFYGWQLGVAAGVASRSFLWDAVAGFVEARAVTAPVIENLLGDQHDSGGASVNFGARITL